jgi:hypothetical protein
MLITPFLHSEKISREDVAALRKEPYSFTALEYKVRFSPRLRCSICPTSEHVLFLQAYPYVEHYWSSEELEDMATWFGQHVPQKRLPRDAKTEAERRKEGRHRFSSGRSRD